MLRFKSGWLFYDLIDVSKVILFFSRCFTRFVFLSGLCYLYLSFICDISFLSQFNFAINNASSCSVFSDPRSKKQLSINIMLLYMHPVFIGSPR